MGAICTKLLSNGWGPYVPSYWQTDWAIRSKLQANGFGPYATSYWANGLGPYVTSYWANGCGPYTPIYSLMDEAICAKLLASG